MVLLKSTAGWRQKRKQYKGVMWKLTVDIEFPEFYFQTAWHAVLFWSPDFPPGVGLFTVDGSSLFTLQWVSSVVIGVSWLLSSGTKFKSGPKPRAFLLLLFLISLASGSLPEEPYVLFVHSGVTVGLGLSLWHPEFGRLTDKMSSGDTYLSSSCFAKVIASHYLLTGPVWIIPGHTHIPILENYTFS